LLCPSIASGRISASVHNGCTCAERAAASRRRGPRRAGPGEVSVEVQRHGRGRVGRASAQRLPVTLPLERVTGLAPDHVAAVCSARVARTLVDRHHGRERRLGVADVCCACRPSVSVGLGDDCRARRATFLSRGSGRTRKIHLHRGSVSSPRRHARTQRRSSRHALADRFALMQVTGRGRDPRHRELEAVVRCAASRITVCGSGTAAREGLRALIERPA